MINLPYEIQSIFCFVLNNYFANQNINVYYTIPACVAFPYIKITYLQIKKQIQSDPIFIEIDIGLTICTDGVCNKQVLNILQSLDIDLPGLLSGSANTDGTVVIENAIIGDSKIAEVLERRSWIATTEFSLIGGCVS